MSEKKNEIALKPEQVADEIRSDVPQRTMMHQSDGTTIGVSYFVKGSHAELAAHRFDGNEMIGRAVVEFDEGKEPRVAGDVTILQAALDHLRGDTLRSIVNQSIDKLKQRSVLNQQRQQNQ